MNGALLAAACGVCLLCCALAKPAGDGGQQGFGGLNLGNNLGGVLDRIGSTIGDNGESVFGRAQYKVINSINDSVCVLVVANSHPHPTTSVVQGASFRTP